MNSGSFFRLDLETSKVVDGVTFFNYIDLPDLYTKDGENRYPIRLSISSKNVSIFVHYYKAEYFVKDEDNGIIVSPLMDEEKRKEVKAIPRHSEEVIINLPYTTNDSEALSSSIKHIYNSTFPFGNYLSDLLKTRYGNDLPVDSDYYNTRKSQINRDSYSALTIWGLLNKEKTRINLLDNKGQITKFLRKLLLDFMFDLMHSDVFECSKYYSQMREGLLSDFFFSSIVKKSEYYYYRRLVKNRLNSIIKPDDNSQQLFDCVKEIRKKNKKRRRQLWWNQLIRPNNSDFIKKVEANVKSIGRDEHFRQVYNTVRSINNLYAEKLDEAEAEWIDVITSPLADKHFSFSPEWYEDIIPRKKSSRFQISESWFVNPEEEMSRIVFPLKDNSKKMHYMNSFELCSLTSSGDNSSVLKRNTKISKWFFRRFDFVDTFRIHFFKHWNHFFASLLLCFSVVAMFPDFWLCPKNIALFPALMAVVFFISFVIHIVNSCGRNFVIIDDLFVKIRRKREGWRSFCFSLLFVSIWIFLYFYDWLSFHWIGVLIKVLSLLGIAVILLYFVKPRVHIIDNIHLFLPRLVASITAAWIMLVIGNDLVKERLSWPTWIILSVVVFAFILYESNKYLPNISTGARVWRALELMLISFSISLVIGVFAIDVLSPSLLVEAGKAYSDGYAIEKIIKCHDWPFLTGESELTITIIPKYLVQFSFLAMFIGVFIQMIFEEKNITEM